MMREKLMGATVEVEFDGPHNEGHYFRPLQRSVRGKFDMMRVGEPMARVQASEWPLPIPSQRLGVDENGIGFVKEPLHDAEFAAIKEKIEKRGLKLEPAVTTFDAIDPPTWYFWMKKAVAAGIAKVVAGSLPSKIEGKPRMNFITNEPVSATDKLAVAIDRQSSLMERLLERLAT